MTLAAFMSGLLSFVFYYPLFMAYVWMIGGVAFYLRHERKDNHVNPEELLPPGMAWPRITIIVPCYNEEANAREVIGNLMDLAYPDYEVIAVNDGSKDRTGEILDELTTIYPKLRVIHQAKNQGKAIGLCTAAPLSGSEILVGIDGDAILDPYTIHWLVRHFHTNPRLGAVTGNPRIRTRSTLLGRLQVGEFSSIIGLIKRCQRFYGRVFTVSGVIVAFRRAALHDIGYWSNDMLTEDIDVSWKLQTRHWQIRFEPHALCWILMPETLKGLWKQRLRWAMGGIQVIRKFAPVMVDWEQRRMWPVFIEYVTSVVWAYAMASTFVLWALGWFFSLPDELNVASVLPAWHGVVIGSTCLMQFGLSMWLDRRYDFGLFRCYVWMIWYPLAFWMLNMTTTVWAVPKTLLRKRGSRAIWSSPDRGMQQPQAQPS